MRTREDLEQELEALRKYVWDLREENERLQNEARERSVNLHLLTEEVYMGGLRIAGHPDSYDREGNRE
jgi:hypothetical protein